MSKDETRLIFKIRSWSLSSIHLRCTLARVYVNNTSSGSIFRVCILATYWHQLTRQLTSGSINVEISKEERMNGARKCMLISRYGGCQTRERVYKPIAVVWRLITLHGKIMRHGNDSTISRFVAGKKKIAFSKKRRGVLH